MKNLKQIIYQVAKNVILFSKYYNMIPFNCSVNVFKISLFFPLQYQILIKSGETLRMVNYACSQCRDTWKITVYIAPSNAHP